MTTNNDLMPCPFCVAKACKSTFSGERARPSDGAHLVVIQCGMCVGEIRRYGESFAIKAWNTRQAQPVQVSEGLTWSELNKPSPESSYDNVTAQSPLGKFSIEWKSWRQYDRPCLYLNGDYIDSYDTLEDAKAAAEDYLNQKAAELQPWNTRQSQPVQVFVSSDDIAMFLQGAADWCDRYGLKQTSIPTGEVMAGLLAVLKAIQAQGGDDA